MVDKFDAFIKKLGIWIIRLEQYFDEIDLISNDIDENVNTRISIHFMDTMKTHLR